MRKRGNIVTDNLGYITIGLLFLIVVIAIIIVILGKGEGIIEFIKNLLRFRG